MNRSEHTPPEVSRKANGRHRFKGGMPEQRRTTIRQILAWASGLDDFRLRGRWRKMRRHPEALFLRCHEIASGPDAAAFFAKLIVATGVDAGAVFALVDRLARRQRLGEALAGRPVTPPPWGSPWGTRWGMPVDEDGRRRIFCSASTCRC
jgi:hypothetical protein